ncbi:hypothetical protein RDMS_03590 [Deinococcus sp. RL]|uniref:hypothetical protein n=1 Tax=Deinococcus sp. RL TaxID=1489678 RepID=UPI0004D5D5F6|nr:hypothetical protein [Deinococcus sp. RL]KEF35127.1 hypothetical protein RDMS_03590 [Deinococcus sp. RL]
MSGTPPAPVRDRSGLRTALRLLGGWALLGLLAWLMWTPGAWPALLLAWVLLTLLADEFGGWFGYLGVLLGGLAFVAPAPEPAGWSVIVPLVGGALLAALLVKHSGGPFVLPFAAAMFALPLLAVARFGSKLDAGLTLPEDPAFLRSALLGMAVGLGVSLLRQVTTALLRRRARAQQRHRQGAAPAAAVPLAAVTFEFPDPPPADAPDAPRPG